jgi:hypothetical protein
MLILIKWGHADIILCGPIIYDASLFSFTHYNHNRFIVLMLILSIKVKVAIRVKNK